MIFAIIPWVDSLLNDNLFDEKDEIKNPDHRFTPYSDMKQEFEKNGDTCHTIDLYRDLKKVDYFLFLELNYKWMEKIVKAGKASGMIYCNAEPPAVYARNCPEGYKKLARFFPYILTWNDDWVDNKLIFKRNIPYYYEDYRNLYKVCNKKLLTIISGNKRSRDPNELYSERERVIAFFEKNYSNEFEFYGTGWSEEIHPAYKGSVVKKAETYSRYKFAICFENSKNLKGYVTEKILDCFSAGIVPIYAGAPNVDEYIPTDCFIDYFQFDNLQEMADFLFNMSAETYNHYLLAADRFLRSEKFTVFSGRNYALYIYQAIAHNKNFKVAMKDKCYLIVKNRFDRAKHRGKNTVKRIFWRNR